MDIGIGGISFGTNDLIQFILVIDRYNTKLVKQFDEKNKAVLQAVEKAIIISINRGITYSMCG